MPLKKLFKTIEIRVNTAEIRREIDLGSNGKKKQVGFKCWDKLIEMHCRSLRKRLVNVIRPSMFADVGLIKVRLLPSHRN